MPKINRTLGGVSSEAVARAPGSNREQWLTLLDGLGAVEMSHKQIVALVAGPGGLSSGWWQQSVTIGYEQARGLRVVGQTAGADFQIGVQKTLPVSPEQVWRLVSEETGREAWLGSAGPMEFRKGEQYRTKGGVWGEVRSAVPGQKARLTWRSPDVAQPRPGSALYPASVPCAGWRKNLCPVSSGAPVQRRREGTDALPLARRAGEALATVRRQARESIRLRQTADCVCKALFLKPGGTVSRQEL